MVNSNKIWVYISIILAITIGTLSHFLYTWSGEARILSVFVPVNESVWEHLKMVYWPFLCIWGIYYLIKRPPNPQAWFFSSLLAILFAQYLILSGHYLFRGSTGKDAIIFDIFLFLLAVVWAQLWATKYYCKLKNPPPLVFTTLALFILALLFMVFTYRPLNLPLFHEV
ncbi:MAG: hypothetical protein GX661_05860 [Acholeplasmataceae bacterium]|nr:hypothetical protein [Acholeplasmataceae bacterium]